MKNLPVGRQNFREIITQNLLYVDKTRQIHQLINSGKLFFLSRPRRFGKSLLLSTFRYIFEGQKELFKELYIGKQTNYNWVNYPVLQLILQAFGHQVENLEAMLSFRLDEYAQEYNVQLNQLSLSTKFQSLIEQISQKGNPIVILIDEYDKPIVDFLLEINKARKNQKVLRDFSPLKDLDAQGHLKFLFITGVSKFSKVSLFSDLNNLTDLTIHPLSTDVVGITHEELLFYFDDYIQQAITAFNMSFDELLNGVKIWYNGYSFDGHSTLYNPFSILNFFSQNRFSNFWFATGTPTFLVETIRDRGINPKDFENKEVANTFFDKFSLKDLDMTGLLFQTGYLTIKSIRQKRYLVNYFLDFPNFEVHNAFFHNLVEAFTYKSSSIVSNALVKMERGLEEGKVKLFIEQLTILLSDISYHLFPNRHKEPKANEFAVWEGYFQTIIYLVTSFMKLYVRTEISKHKGRLDLLAETEDFLYIMEFNPDSYREDKPAKDAIQQIKEKEYAASYKNSPKPIYLVGIGFSKEKRNIKTWEVEIWDRE